jgi:DNA ligase-1
VAQALPSGSVLDGELICWQQNAATPLGFDQLQRRLGRKTVGATLKRDCPMQFIAYDLLEHQGVDIRQQGLRQRQQQLAALLETSSIPSRGGCSRARPGRSTPGRSWRHNATRPVNTTPKA